MSKALIIVESPAKIKTLKKFLGAKYIFESSVGHIRDLPANEFGIDMEKDFEPTYTLLPEKKEVVKKLIKAAKGVDEVYLCPDPDREGEAIAWHIASILPPGTPLKRVSFNAITKDAVADALRHPREIDNALVDAQQARRLLDRIVGYKISPLLNRRIQRGKGAGVSAGRVQSVALKLVVDREREIEAFCPVEYWNLGAFLKANTSDRQIKAHLYSVDGKKVEKEPIDGKDLYLIGNEASATPLLERLERAHYDVQKVERKEKKRHPVPPFITSTLQQEASRYHRFSSTKTMSLAQELYEGIDLGQDGSEGLITYMRTDSVRVAPEALQAARHYIKSTFGEGYLPLTPRVFSSKKSAQDAHEAIRPANLENTPEKVRPFLNRQQFLLYELIWKRFIASQMTSAVYDTVSVDIGTDQGLMLRSSGSVLKFPGFLAIYEEKEDEDLKADEDRLLPDLQEGQSLDKISTFGEQAFTKAPPRYTEASLVKELEKSGIGRPSTYAAIMNKIQSRDYTTKENGRLKPTELGMVIADFLSANFQQIMDIGFTAAMEDDLEAVADNQKAWKSVIRDFWTRFAPTLDEAEKSGFIPKVLTQIPCPKCGAMLQKIWSKARYFYGCSRYPDCDYTSSAEELSFNKDDYAEDFDWDQPCPQCGGPMKLRHGRFGPFLGCVRYPECRGIVNLPKKGEAPLPQEDLPACPAIGCDGKMMARKSRFGKIFYSCSNFPDCDVITNSVEELASKYPHHPKTPYQRVAKGKKATAKKGKAVAKKKTASTSRTPKSPSSALQLSASLAAVVGSQQLTRGEVLKKVWEYIREHQLQDPKDKRVIRPDARMAAVFGSREPVQMFHMTKLLGQHMSK